MNSVVSSPNSVTDNSGPFRVMVVDDSAIIRGFLCRYLSEDPNIDVVTTANNGVVALRQLAQHDIEAVVLDIEMPEMDGMTALPKMIDMKPDIQVVMASTLTRKNAEVSLRALQRGAVDYVPKSETARSVNANIDFRRELVEKVKAWASRRRTKLGHSQPTGVGSNGSAATAGPAFASPTRPSAAGFVSARRPAAAVSAVSSKGKATPQTSVPLPNRDGAAAPIALRKGSTQKPKILLIGSSTGGPQALMKFFSGFAEAPSVPILVTQHMPATFTAILADHLAQATGWPACEGADGMKIKAGHIYVAPGGRHMEIDDANGNLTVKLTDEPPENFCRPAVDPLLRSAGKIFGERILAVILTGMGHDGLKGAREITKGGATLLAQDEATRWCGVCQTQLPARACAQKFYRSPRSGQLQRNACREEQREKPGF